MSYAKFKVLIGMDPARTVRIHDPQLTFMGASQEDIANTIINALDPDMVSGSELMPGMFEDEFGAGGLWVFHYKYIDGRATLYVIIREVDADDHMPDPNDGNLLGLDWELMKPSDFETFAGAQPGTWIAYSNNSTFLWHPDDPAMVHEVHAPANGDLIQRDWKLI